MVRRIIGFYLILYISLLFVSAVSLLGMIVAAVPGGYGVHAGTLSVNN